MSPEETTNLLTERCREITASGWQDYLPSPDGDDPRTSSSTSSIWPESPACIRAAS